jgi:hypothetical protein
MGHRDPWKAELTSGKAAQLSSKILRNIDFEVA